MPTRDTASQGTPCWLDLGTTDKARSLAFYTELFGLSAEDGGEEFGHYTTLSKDGAGVAGAMGIEPGQGVDGWSIYLNTPDVQKVVDAAVANGGQVAMPPMAVGDLGSMAFVIDPGGAFIGAWQPGEHAGFAVHNEDGATGWFELFTRDWDGAVAFYRDVFGATVEVMSDTPEFRYAIIMGEGLQWAGIMDAAGFLPEGVPAHWSVYFHVDDEEAAIAKAVSLGATVVQPAEETPYGRLATLTDPVGATFKLVEPPAEG